MTIEKQRNATDPLKPQIGKDEMNLCELPIARLGRRDTRDVIEFMGEVVKDGQTITQEWIVSGTARVGLPTEFAERVLVALISLAAAEGFQNKKTMFTIYEILKLMGLEISGFHYQEVTLALKRLHGVTITSQNSWWDNEKKKYCTISEGFGLIDRYWIKRVSDKTSETGGGYVIWNDWLWESFQAGYIKNIDTRFYYALEHTLARRLYRFLDKRMHYQNSYQIDIFALAARLGMADYQYPSKVKEKLQPAFDELIARNYLRQAEIIKVGKFTRVRFARTVTSTVHQASLWDAAEETAETASAASSEAEALQGEEITIQTHDERLAALYAHYETSAALKQIWANIVQEWKQTMQSASYLTIAKSVLLDVQGGTAVIAVDAKMIDWAKRQLSRKIRASLTISLTKKITTLEFIALP